jgi:perosamine synthetase
MNNKLNRRNFINTVSVVGAGLAMGMPASACASRPIAQPAILGGPSAYKGTWSGWPIQDQLEEKELLNVLKSGLWGRLHGNNMAKRFEEKFQELNGSKHVLAVSSGTKALYTMLGALDIGPGDEVIIPPYTFIATYNVVVLHYALPIFVDSDIESFQIDPQKIEAAISDRTKVLMPVHIGGYPADLDAILSIANKHNIPVIEDACQAHLAEWKGKCVGNQGLAGAFSFQASKNLNSGEGGAITTNNEEFWAKCDSFHHQGQRVAAADSLEPGTGTRGTNVRITDFQASILLAQMSRLGEQVKRRSENADYLTSMLEKIPGIKPAKLYNGATRSAYHLYMFNYDKARFAGMDRAKFFQAMRSEGVPCSGGYGRINKDPFVTSLAKNKHYLKIYGEKTMKDWLDRNQCPVNDKLTEQAVWFYQTMLLGTKTDMEQIAEAVHKIQRHAEEIKES